MHTYTQSLQALLSQHANAKQAAPMAKYMRDQFSFLGIKTPQRRELLKQFIAEQGKPPLDDLETILRDLWQLPQREYQYSALTLLDKWEKKLPPEFVNVLEYLVVTKSWWDTVDLIAGHPVATHFSRFPQIRDEFVAQWRASDNFWLRRTALLFQLHYKTRTDVDLLFALIHENLDSDEFFIQKAIGWALREYSKTDADAVIAFVDVTSLAPLSAREALKWLKNQGRV
ncbi:MAG: DNA alkylation repair protein [Ardenticatenaceae bacterium]|nr:DNA alkylation repair protein [Ardenticatenaceae bacterium]